MNTIPTIFDFNSAAVRVISDDSGEPWFSAKDVCGVLGYRNDSDAIKKHCREKGVAKRDTLTDGGIQPLTFINEGNLYRLIVKSRKPEAEAFEIKVMEEILPAIRKTGKYEPEPYAQNPGDKLTKDQADTLRQLLTGSVKKLPKEKQAGAMIKGWSKLKAHFKCGYRDIPQGDFTEAVSILSRHVIDGEYLPAPDAAVNAETEKKNIPQSVIGEYLQLHINRKTHEIALGQYDAIRGIITEAIQGNLNCGATEAEAHDCVEAYGDSASEVIVMNKRDVFMLASQTTQLLNSAGQALETIHRLERHVGRNLYLRKEHGKRGMFGLPESLVESVISAATERLAA